LPCLDVSIPDGVRDSSNNDERDICQLARQGDSESLHVLGHCLRKPSKTLTRLFDVCGRCGNRQQLSANGKIRVSRSGEMNDVTDTIVRLGLIAPTTDVHPAQLAGSLVVFTGASSDSVAGQLTKHGGSTDRLMFVKRPGDTQQNHVLRLMPGNQPAGLRRRGNQSESTEVDLVGIGQAGLKQRSNKSLLLRRGDEDEVFSLQLSVFVLVQTTATQEGPEQCCRGRL